MGVKLQCSRCKITFDGIDEHDAEVKFNNHNCKYRGRTLHDLTDLELCQIISGEKTEEQIWNERVKNFQEVLYFCDWCGELLISDEEHENGLCEKCKMYLERRV